jgi:hypothetical protein
LLVPIREAGSLLPQLGISAWIRGRPKRKWIWAAASVGQGAFGAGDGGFGALARRGGGGRRGVGGACASSPVRALPERRFGELQGRAGQDGVEVDARDGDGGGGLGASALVLLFGVLISLGVLPRTVPMVVGALVVAALLWLVAAAVFATLAEEEGATEGGGSLAGRLRRSV